MSLYKKKKERADFEILQKMHDWADSAEIAVKGVKPVIQNLINTYILMDELEKNKDEDITFLLSELIWTEILLEEEIKKNEDYEITIH